MKPLLLLSTFTASDMKWSQRTDSPIDGFFLEGGALLFGCMFHVEARPVEYTTREGVQVNGPEGKALTAEQRAVADSQWGLSDEIEEDLRHLRIVNAATSPYETVVVCGYDCVITITPFCK